MKLLHKLVSAAVLLTAAIVPFAASAQDENISVSPVYNFADNSEVEGGWSSVRYYDNGVAMTLHTAGLEPGSAYTVWWVIFNDPASCSGGACNMDDIFVVDENGVPVRDEQGQRIMAPEALDNANVSIQFAAGGAVSENGKADFAASLGLGAVPGIIYGPGLLDPQTSEVHLVVRTHGPIIDELFDDQIVTFGGGCEPMDAAPCDDVQYTFHLPAAQS